MDPVTGGTRLEDPPASEGALARVVLGVLGELGGQEVPPTRAVRPVPVALGAREAPRVQVELAVLGPRLVQAGREDPRAQVALGAPEVRVA
jgi:hypothetical protein